MRLPTSPVTHPGHDAVSMMAFFLNCSTAPLLHFSNLPVKLIGGVATRWRGAVIRLLYVWQGVLGSLCRTGFRNVKADLHCVAALGSRSRNMVCFDLASMWFAQQPPQLSKPRWQLIMVIGNQYGHSRPPGDHLLGTWCGAFK
jgi:hypothetical protein